MRADRAAPFGTEIMTRARAIRRICGLVLLAGAGLLPAPLPASAADDLGEEISSSLESTAAVRHVRLGKNKSVIVELPVDVKDVLVSSPKVADAVMRSTRKAFVIGIDVGNTNVFFFDGSGRQVLTLDVSVEHDVAALQSTLRRLVPSGDIQVEGMKDSVVLTGPIANAADAKKATEIAARFVDDEKKVVNMLTVKGGDQVMLKVTVAEVQRSAIKQLGVDLIANVKVGNFRIGGQTNQPFTVTGEVPSNALGARWFDGLSEIDTTVRALERNGQLKTLAEPTLTAVSGESADFLAGGEFPIPITESDDKITVEYKKYGVGLAFTPVVLSEGRISLRVQTEVSELTNEGAVTLRSISIRGLKVRRANTTVELPSGGSMAIAGLMQDDVRQDLNGTPGLMDVPILGTLFKSRDFRAGQTELVIIVTPFIAAHAERSKLARPDDGLEPATDPESILLGRLNRVYGRGAVPKGVYKGHYGFILD